MSTVSHEQMYELARKNAGKTSIKELAKQVGTRGPLFITYVMAYAQQNKLPIPKFAIDETLTTIKHVSRKSPKSDVRVSWMRIKNAGLENCLEFDLISDATRGELKLVPSKWVTSPVSEIIKETKLEIDRAVSETPKKKIGRPKGSKNKATLLREAALAH